MSFDAQSDGAAVGRWSHYNQNGLSDQRSPTMSVGQAFVGWYPSVPPQTMLPRGSVAGKNLKTMAGGLSVALGLLSALASPVIAQGTPSPGTQPFAPIEIIAKNGIASIPASLTGHPGNPEAGGKVVIDRGLGNCLSCHEISTLRSQEFHGEIGPPLVGAGGRWDRATLRMIVVNARRYSARKLQCRRSFGSSVSIGFGRNSPVSRS